MMHLVYSDAGPLTWIYFDFLEVPLENFSTALHIWSGDGDLHIKAAWPDQSAGKQESI